MDEKRIADVIRKRYVKLRGNQQPIFDRVEMYRQMYRAFMTEDEFYPWDYQLVDPQIFPLMRAYLSRLNPAAARVLLEGKDKNTRQINQDVVNWELNEILITQVLYRNMFTGFMAGRGYLKTGWKYEPAVQIKTNNRQIEMRGITNRADVKNVRFNDMFVPDRNNPDIHTQIYLVERMSKPFGEFLDENEQTEYWKPEVLQEIRDKKMFDNKVDYGVDLPEDDSMSNDEKEDMILRSQMVKCLCMHTLDGGVFYTLEKDSDKILNKDQENIYWHGHYPYIDFAPFPEDDEFFNLGIVQPNADLQIAMSSTLNQLLTNTRKAGNPMWITGQSAAQTPDWMFVNRPDGIIRVVGDTNQVVPIRTPDTSQPLINMRQELQIAFERGTSMSSLYSSGVSSTPTINKTATGARIIDQNMDANIQLLISLYGAQILKKLGEHFLELNAQFITEKQTIEITGKPGDSQFVEVDPQQISANFVVKSSADRLLKQSPAQKQAGMLNLATTFGSLKQQGAPINMRPVIEAVVDSFPETEEINNIIIDPETKANDAISSIMRNFPPMPAVYDDDHKAMISIMQKYMIQNKDLTPEQTKAFAEYIQDLYLWIQSKQQIIQPPNQQPQLQPLDPQALAQSMASQGGQPGLGSNLPIPMTPNGLGQ